MDKIEHFDILPAFDYDITFTNNWGIEYVS